MSISDNMSCVILKIISSHNLIILPSESGDISNIVRYNLMFSLMSHSSTALCQTHSDTGFRWKGQRRGVFSICWTEAGGRPEEAGGSLQEDLLQEPRWPPHCEPPLERTLEGVERDGPWPWFGPSPPPGFGAFCMALWIKKKKCYKWYITKCIKKLIVNI